MPVKKEKIVPQKQRLTIQQVATYDDILTDALVDHVYFWTSIRKNRNAYHSTRGVREEDVTSIIQKHVIIEKDLSQAEIELLKLPGLKNFLGSLKTDKEKEDFRKHLKKYISIYLPDCPFEVSTTNRYTIDTHEAAVTARRFIKKGEVIKYLCGVQVMMTPEEEKFVQSSKRDFSIVISSRKKTPSIFLGPARFSNHDCDANARLSTTGTAGMEVIAVRDIDLGEEVTVAYGDNYFGEDNCECLCHTCEKRGESGWSHGGDVETAPKPSIEDEATLKGHYSFRRRRRLESEETISRNQSLTPDVNLRPHVAKRTPSSLTRFKNTESSLGNSPKLEPRSLNFQKRKIGSPLKTQKSAESPVGDQSLQKAEQPEVFMEVTNSLEDACEKDPDSLPKSSPQSFVDAVSSHPSPISSGDISRRGSISTAADGHTSTDATSVDDDTIIVQQPLHLTPTIPAAIKRRGSKVSDVLEQAKTTEAIIIGPSTSLQHPAIEVVASAPESVLSELDNAEMNVLEQSLSSITTDTPSKKRGRKKKRKLEDDTEDGGNTNDNKRKRSDTSPTPEAPTVNRVPGDYVLTPTLLAQPASAWINCSICEEPFVQENAYFTRSSCPRCERHSKLYGYMWPKTDKEGRDDSEERVLDHRTVHRFIRPEEERSIRRKNHNATGSRTVSRAVTREASVPIEVADHEEEEPVPKVRSRRGRPVKQSRKTM
ncbi:SET [Glarea lozoyensis ATCC 20868]|uniref:Histone-lysine N-methyltransferase SET9 n=1 Tax=Glarea lozoyensis (strain ATCC 20868 / MF5171) TaxID=1116229 RepID=S3D6E7_GLAL2|nr:SET [Glarea lozoyensis ATCC 20868]EPE32704.1 SET [Glarea lozoyensis ATCC 20868]